MNQASTTASPRVFFNKYGGNTESCCDINFSYLPALYHASFKYCDAKFARAVQRSRSAGTGAPVHFAGAGA